MPKFSGFMHQVRLLAFIFEGWAYGLANAKLRAAYRNVICGMCRGNNRIAMLEVREAPRAQQMEVQTNNAARPTGPWVVDVNN